MNTVDIKKNFIRSWYNLEKSQYDYLQQMELAREWIKICVDNDEFEMAGVLAEEMQKTREARLARYKKNRSCVDAIRYIYIKLKRKKGGRK